MTTEKKKARALPTFVTPMAAVAVKQPREGEGWLYEVEFDGYRALIIKDGSRVELQELPTWISRRGAQRIP